LVHECSYRIWWSAAASLAVADHHGSCLMGSVHLWNFLDDDALSTTRHFQD
jgi:hypothetical protein